MDEFGGYGKPVLKLRQGRLVVENTPAPTGSWRRRLDAFTNLGSLQLLRKAGERFGVTEARQKARAEAVERALTLKIFEELQALEQRDNRLLVLLYVPGIEDYTPDSLNDQRREFLRQEAERRGSIYIDLTDSLRKLSQGNVEERSEERRVGKECRL